MIQPWSIIRFLAETVRVFFYLLVFARIYQRCKVQVQKIKVLLRILFQSLGFAD